MKPHRTYVSRWLVPALVLVAISQITAGLTDFQRDELSKVEAAESFYNSRNYEKAAESYQQGYFMTSKSRGLMFRYGMSLVRSDRPDAAESILNKVIHDNPIEPMWDRGRSYSETASIKAMAHFQLGVIYGNRQWWDLALGSFESADANDRSDWQPPFNIAVILLNHRNDPFQALDFLHDALNRSPDRADIKNLIANCHNTIGVQRDQAGDEAGALSAFSEALRWRRRTSMRSATGKPSPVSTRR